MHEPTPPGLSPYRPPVVLAEQAPKAFAATQSPLPLPLWGSAVFAAAAVAMHIGAVFGERPARDLIMFSIQPILPPALLALFTLFCVRWYNAQSLAGSRLLRGKLLIVLVLPPVSLLIFVPAFLAITLLVGVTVAHWPLLMVSGLAGAYFLTAVGISRWLWWWFASQI
jgi:hypothetical protein